MGLQKGLAKVLLESILEPQPTNKPKYNRKTQTKPNNKKTDKGCLQYHKRKKLFVFSKLPSYTEKTKKRLKIVFMKFWSSE